MSEMKSPKKTLILGGVWAVGTRWAIRGIGLLNTVIMARLVLPADYGIVAMAYLVVALIQAITDFGATTALMRKQDVTRDEIDSVWTLRIIQGLVVGILILVASPFAAMYFKEPRVQYVLWTLAVCVAIAGLGNIGTTLAQKEFNFSLEFRLNVIGKIVGVIGTVSSGYFLRDYRALVIGISGSYVAGVVLSYYMHPYRARWNTSKIGEIWALTKWLMFAGVGGFILRKGDELIAARIGTTSDYGLYNVGSDFGQMPTGEVGPAMLRALMPVLASLKGSTSEINAAVIKTLSAITTITFPIGLGFAAIAGPATILILGANWENAAQYVGAFALLSTFQIIQNPVSTLLIVRGHTTTQSMAVWTEFGVFLLAALLLVPHLFLMGLVWARMLGTIANIAVNFVMARKYCDFPMAQSGKALLRPAIGSLIMYYVVQEAMHSTTTLVYQLSIGILVGIIFFTVWSALTWLVFGKPDGLEATIFAGVKSRISLNRSNG